MTRESRSLSALSPTAKGYDLVIDFFSNIGLSREASMYLKMFRNLSPWKFAVVLISADTLRHSLKEVSLDLAYLCGLNLYPVIVLDNLYSGEHKLVRPVEAPQARKYKTGQRIRLLSRTNNRLVSSITAAGGRAMSIYTEMFSLNTPLSDGPDFDFRLLVDHLQLGPVRDAVRRKKIPVISPVVMDSDGRTRVMNSEVVSKALCSKIEPQKFIVISEQGGIKDQEGHRVRNVIISTDYQELVESGTLDRIALRQMEAVVRLLNEVPELTVQIASAGKLLYELFTVKGRGTYIRTGHSILMAESFDKLDISSLHRLMEDGFGKTLVPDYFDRPPHKVFYERNYHGAIVVKPLQEDIYYLDKFVVGRQWQGEGIGGPLWRELTKHYDKIIWRAGPENPINRWYLEQADGFQRTDQWNIYWIGLTPDQVGGLIRQVSNIRKTVV
jgi:bifunctional N-acetylglutamate synthase/kinase